ncbi:hypothetical protein TrST_g2214 [Triparma strigata]|uniref:EamA domain-containing protein n=1 Tax=Triparma strigata TaxID=1606541 RepID=A0A9W6ZLZ1_9STRA|nr:hypothetical protein TrST_g2214 [Triparma strigata]
MESFVSGVASSFSSVLAKCALDSDGPVQRHLLRPSTCCGERPEEWTDKCKLADAMLRAMFFVAMLSLNAMGLSKHIDGMKSNGSAAGVALSTCWNFTATVAFGAVLFGEQFFFNRIWLLGFSLILLGGWLLSTVNISQTAKTKKS